MRGSQFVPMAGWGSAFEASALRLRVFSRQELMAGVSSIRQPSTDAAKEWLARQVRAGAVVRLRGDRRVCYKVNAKENNRKVE